MQIKTKAGSYYYRVQYKTHADLNIHFTHDFSLVALHQYFIGLKTYTLRTKTQVIKAIEKFKYNGKYLKVTETKLTKTAKQLIK